MRGKVLTGDVRDRGLRITPAYAGKSFRSDRPKATVRDHPRLCGEKWTLTEIIRIRKGSPPPMRGKVSEPTAVFAVCGITPAYAGKSESRRSTQKHGKDHPRLCGEKQIC